jgi:hypothetical protein
MALAIRNLTFEIKHINTQAIFAVGQSWSDVADRWHTICTYIDLAICRTIVTFQFAEEGCHFYLPGFYGRKLLIGALRFQRAAYLRRAAYRAANTVGLKFVERQMGAKKFPLRSTITGELVARRRVAELALIGAKRTPFAKTECLT